MMKLRLSVVPLCLCIAMSCASVASADETPAARHTKVTFDAENTMYVDGRPFVPIFLWHGGTEQAAVAGENISRRMLSGGPQYWRRWSPIQYAFIRATTLESDWKEQVRTYVPQVRQHPSTLVYFLTHEPGFAAEPPERVNEMARMIRELDPDHPSFVHIGGDNPIRAKTYSADSKILSISSMGISPGLMAVKMARAQLVTDHERAVWPCLHPFNTNYDSYADDQTACTDLPTLRAGVYSALISGAKGLSLYAPDHYFYWFSDYRHKHPKKRDVDIISAYEGMDELLAEVRALTPLIAAPTCRQVQVVSGEDGRVNTLLKSVGGELFLFAVNYTIDAFDATFDVSAATQGKAFEVRAPFEGKSEWLGRTVQPRSTGGVFTDRFGPFEVHVYRITARADMNRLKDGDADFDLPAESKAERLARFQVTMDRVLPKVVFSPLGDRDPMYWDEVGGRRQLRLEASQYARPLKLVASQDPPRASQKRDLNAYADVTRHYLLPRPGATVTVTVKDVKHDGRTPPGLLLIGPDGKETRQYAAAGSGELSHKFRASAGGVYTLIVKSLGHQVSIDGCPSSLDAGTVLNYTGDGTTLYFHVPAGLTTFSVTSMVAKGPKKGVGEGNMIEVLDRSGRVLGQGVAHYLERMLPMEQGGGERSDWRPSINDPGPAKVTVKRSPEEAARDGIYAVRLGKPPADQNLSYVSTFYLRLDAPLSGLCAERPEDILRVEGAK